MVRITIHDGKGESSAIDATPGDSLMQAAKAAGIDGIEAECGGSMVCGTCQVYVGEDWYALLPPASAMEAEMIEYTRHPQPRSRLSCQIVVTAGLEGMDVTTPPSQR